MPLHTHLLTLARAYARARTEPFAGHPLVALARRTIPQAARARLAHHPHDLRVKASVGPGDWASVPWLAIMDPLATTTVRRGVYVVVLIDADRARLHLALVHGVLDLQHEFGAEAALPVLRRRAEAIAARLPDHAPRFAPGPVALPGGSGLVRGYERAVAFGAVNDGDAAAFDADLAALLAAYDDCVRLSADAPLDRLREAYGGTTAGDTRARALSARIEGAAPVRRAALRLRGRACEGCGLAPARDYAVPGADALLDVHHMAGALPPPGTPRWTADDLRVLCPTCHRALHALGDGADVEALRAAVRFAPARLREG